MRGNEVLGWCKARTSSPSVNHGLEEAIKGALRMAQASSKVYLAAHARAVFHDHSSVALVLGAADVLQEQHGIDVRDVGVCMLGTTQFVNALVQRKGLARQAHSHGALGLTD